MTRTVILDTDPGIDDAMALLYLARHPDIALHSVTTVFGNGPVDMTARNAAFLVDRFALGVPVYRGAEAPLAGDRHVPALKVHGEDGLGDTGLAADFVPMLSAKPAWQHLVDTILANPGQITIVAIAPLTNLALALRHRPDIAGLVDEVIVMGGAFGRAGRHGNIRPNAEANFFYDPLAADMVLAADWRVSVVGLDVTTDCIVTSRQAQALARSSEAGAFLFAVSRGYEQIYRDFDGIDGFCSHDVAAAVLLTDPQLFETEEQALRVDTSAGLEGHARILDQSERALGRRRRQRIGVRVDGRAVVETWFNVIGADHAVQAANAGSRHGTPKERR